MNVDHQYLHVRLCRDDTILSVSAWRNRDDNSVIYSLDRCDLGTSAPSIRMGTAASYAFARQAFDILVDAHGGPASFWRVFRYVLRGIVARAVPPEPPGPLCGQCGTTENVQLEPSMSRYRTELAEDHPLNPNQSLLLCPDCAKEYREYWTERWEAYHRECM